MSLSRYQRYQEFLESDFWTRLRNKAIERDGRKCVRCGYPWKLQVHHKFYRHDWYHTLLSDLETLCDRCHKQHHLRHAIPDTVNDTAKPFDRRIHKSMRPQKSRNRRLRRFRYLKQKFEWTA